MADAASAADTGSRSVLITGTTGENPFVKCTFGTDTVTRSAANATLELAGGTPRNKFINCDFPSEVSAAGALHVITSAASAIDRWQKFDNCCFLNDIKSSSTQMTVAVSMAASAGGYLLMKNSTSVGSTKWGDAAALTQMYVDGAAPTAATSGLAVNPA